MPFPREGKSARSRHKAAIELTLIVKIKRNLTVDNVK